jgi:hypothetical protein
VSYMQNGGEPPTAPCMALMSFLVPTTIRVMTGV